MKLCIQITLYIPCHSSSVLFTHILITVELGQNWLSTKLSVISYNNNIILCMKRKIKKKKKKISFYITLPHKHLYWQCVHRLTFLQYHEESLGTQKQTEKFCCFVCLFKIYCLYRTKKLIYFMKNIMFLSCKESTNHIIEFGKTLWDVIQ